MLSKTSAGTAKKGKAKRIKKEEVEKNGEKTKRLEKMEKKKQRRKKWRKKNKEVGKVESCNLHFLLSGKEFGSYEWEGEDETHARADGG